MDTLVPPHSPHSRLRASSTNVRPALTLSTCGSRRRSNSLLDMPPSSPSHTPPRVSTPAPEKSTPSLSLAISTPSDKPASDSMLSALLSRCLQLLHSSHVDAVLPMTPSSPRISRASTSSDDTILPISSPTRAFFVDAAMEKQPSKSRPRWIHTPSVCAFNFARVTPSLTLFHCQGPCSRTLRYSSSSAFGGCCLVLHFHSPNNHGLAQKSHRPRSTRSRTPRILTEWPWPYGSCNWGYFRNCCVETRLVNTR